MYANEYGKIMSQMISAYMQNMEKNIKYDADAVIKMPGFVAPSPGETACQNHHVWGNRYNADLIIPFGL